MESRTDGAGLFGLLSFPIDCGLVLKHLNQDMRDDWFTDVIGYRDLFSKKDDLQNVLSRLLEEGNGQYPGVSRNLCDIPKKGLGLRYALETDFYDRFIYQAICSFLIKYYDPILSNRVFGHRWNSPSGRSKCLFKSRIGLWQTFEGITYASLVNENTLVVTDLINYFENISINSIRIAFLSKLSEVKANGYEKLQIRNAIKTMCLLLEKWSYSERHGLPQNRDCSSFIANVVLSDVDHKMVEMGHDYFRYVDDIRIVCADKRRARKAISDLISQLRTVGMNINSAKTAILETPQDEQVANFFPAIDSRTIAIDGMWKSKSRRVIARSVPLVCKMLAELVASSDTQSRQFRFAVNRLKILLEAGLFLSKSDASAELAGLIISALDSQPASTDQFCRILSLIEFPETEIQRIERYLIDSVISIHPWQNYHLWILLAFKNYKSEALVSLAEARITNNSMSAEVPAIFAYLASVDKDSNSLKYAATILNPDWPFQHQRYLLLSTRNFDKEFLQPLFGKIGIRFKGTAARAKSHLSEGGSIVRLPEASNILKIYDEISVYD
ncbi:hypothetical protein FHY35_003323 [Xanthomonas arboricola]|uniref:RNA-directed DNA polymerase n=1 Tax=Xanthomonas arboricola TaxID=56448 RepID=UPI00141B1289|nr:RNA-directed DNA polymerase [Xanthomonas arboricola]NIJ86279.1 hypothetical protein [Xanthomonas arboricola]